MYLNPIEVYGQACNHPRCTCKQAQQLDENGRDRSVDFEHASFKYLPQRRQRFECVVAMLLGSSQVLVNAFPV
jgi:hypothetical protein